MSHLYISVRLKPSTNLKKACNFNPLDLASELRVKGVMKLLDDNLLAQAADDIGALGELGEEDMDFLNSLEEMAKEVDDEPNSID